MFSLIVDLFCKNETNGVVIDMDSKKGWGNSIRFHDWERRRIVGWLTPIPKVGTEIRSKMESGKIGRFKIIKVEPCGDPSDMFFATVKDLDYLK